MTFRADPSAPVVLGAPFAFLAVACSVAALWEPSLWIASGVFLALGVLVQAGIRVCRVDIDALHLRYEFPLGRHVIRLDEILYVEYEIDRRGERYVVTPKPGTGQRPFDIYPKIFRREDMVTLLRFLYDRHLFKSEPEDDERMVGTRGVE